MSLIELNNMMPWYAVMSVMKKYDKNPNDDRLSFNEFAVFHNDEMFKKKSHLHKCTMRQEDSPEIKNINRCSSLSPCYDFGAKKYSNLKCGLRESCGKFRIR